MAAIVGTSTGYVGTSPAPSIEADKWASLQAMFGKEYFVASSTAARVTVQTGLTVRIAAGASSGTPQYIGGGGVVDKLTGSVDLTLPTPGSDGTIYRPIYAHRTWGTTNATTFEYGASVTTQTIPTRTVDPGNTTDDQPLALVRIVKAGATLTATVVDDLRAVGWASGSYEATSLLVLDYMNKPGYRIRIAGIEWLRTMAGAWEKIASPIEQATSFGSSMDGWSSASTTNQPYLIREGRKRTMFLEQRRLSEANGGGTISPTATGHIANASTFLLGEGDRPTFPAVVGCLYNGAAGDYGGTVQINPTGHVFLCAMSPDADLTVTAAGGWSLRVYASWYTA